MNRRTNRREFVKVTAAAGVGFWAAGGVAPKKSIAANETINFAAVGVGGKGNSDSDDAGRNGNLVGICDIDENNLNRKGAKYPSAKKYFDYRKMLDELGKTIDAVTVSTPDHSHAVAAAASMQLGKHCFTQKPLTQSIWEARRLGEIAREKGVATQMGNQGTANNGLREAAALVKAGVLGTVKEAHVWTNRPVWPQGIGRPADKPSVPSHVHWPEWISRAKMRPYHPAYHPFKWRGWWEFGTGALGDMACHTLNMPYMALDLADPTMVVAETSGHNGETFPKWSVIDFDFPANDNRPGVKLVWYDGGKLPEEKLFKGQKVSRSGALLIGDKATLFSPADYGANFTIVGADKTEVEYKRSPGHFQEWVDAIKGGEPAVSNFPDYSGPLTETILLGNLAVWADGKEVKWDAKNLVCTNSKEYDHIIKPEFHNGYSL